MKKNKYLITSIFVFAIIAIAITMGSYFIFAQTKEKVFFNNTIVDGVDISGLNLVEASEKVNQSIDSKCIEAGLTLKYNDNEWFFGGGNFTAVSNSGQVLEKILRKGESGTSVAEGRLSIEYVFNGLEDKLEEVFAEIEQEPQNAEVKFCPDEDVVFEIKPHVEGIVVDRESLTRDILRKLKKENRFVVNIPTITIMPEILTQDVERATRLQSNFCTDYSKSSEDRKANIKLAFEKINGTILPAGEEFSFNNVVGERTAENGFKEAKVILAGEYENGIGGGVCQASTTLYNAVIRAGLDVVEVKPHSIPASYVPLSLDAMVSWGYSDLRFVNNTSSPIYIKAITDDKKLCVTIYGDSLKENQKIVPRAELVKTIPHQGDKIISDTEGKYQDKIMFKGEFVREKSPKKDMKVGRILTCMKMVN